MRKRGLVGFVFLTLLVSFLLIAQNAYAMTTLTAHSVYSESHYQVQGLKMLAEKVNKLTAGSVQINVVCGGALGYKGPDLLRVVKEGQLDISEIVSTGLTGSSQIFGVRSLPMLINGWNEAEKFNKIARPYYEKICDQWNQKLLIVSSWPFADLWTTKQVNGMDDLKGMKVRTYDRSGALFVDAFGGTPLALPLAELYTAFSTGLVQGTISSAVSARESNIYEVTKYSLPIQATTSSSIVTINKAAWDKLSPNEQKALSKASEETEKWLAKKVKDVVKEDMATIKSKKPGFIFQTMSPKFRSELEKAAEKVQVEFIKNNPETKPLYDEFMQSKGK